MSTATQLVNTMVNHLIAATVFRAVFFFFFFFLVSRDFRANANCYCCAPRERAMSIGIPIKLLHEAEGHIVTLETTCGEIYRGKLLEAEDNMNCQMQGITVTARDGRVTQIEQVFIRGSMIRFLILPDMLKNAPMFKPKSAGSRGLSAGGGKSAMLRAQGWWETQ